MAAKNKIKGRGTPPLSREDLDLQDLLGLHFQASRRLEEVLEQIAELRLVGRIAEAGALRMHAEGMQQGLRALEAEVRTATRAPRETLTCAEGSTGPDFEAAMDPGVAFKVAR